MGRTLGKLIKLGSHFGQVAFPLPALKIHLVEKDIKEWNHVAMHEAVHYTRHPYNLDSSIEPIWEASATAIVALKILQEGNAEEFRRLEGRYANAAGDYKQGLEIGRRAHDLSVKEGNPKAGWRYLRHYADGMGLKEAERRVFGHLK